MDLEIDLNLNLDECNKEGDEREIDNIKDGEDGKILEFYDGMEFDSYQEAYSCYLKYAKLTGFGIATRSSRRSKTSGEFIDVKFVCTRYGLKRESCAANQRPCLKIDCKSMLHVKKKLGGKWYVHSFIKTHNHELYPAHAHYFPCHRRITSSNKNNINNLHAVGVSTSKIFAAIAKHHGGYENVGFLEKDIRNHLDKERHLALEMGDAKAMLEHFVHMQEENPNFFYAIDLDEEQRLKNVFWVDAKSREDYKIFGDVVSFDTTYITNKYKMPLAPFIGVNNHFQSILFGCALLKDETTSTFVWLMKTWIKAMGGKPPSAILTDQDKAMKAAIAIVFPNTRHRFCLWHILRKVPEKLVHVIKANESFMRSFNNCIYNSWTNEDFESKWWNMIKTCKLEENEWLESLFEDRKYWVPVYMRDAFFAGMSTTQRSESINSFFDKYVSKKTSLKEFVEQYKVAFQDRQEKEVYADFCTWHKKPTLKSPSPFEKQMSTIYTHEVFKKFQVEVLGASACFSIHEKEDNGNKTLRVQDFEKNEDFVVIWDAENQDITCLCRMFEYYGFLCRHTICVLQSFGIFNIPPHYILKRWTNDAKSLYSTKNFLERIESKKERFNELYCQAIKLSEEGSLSEKSFSIAYHALKEALERCTMENYSLKETKELEFGFNDIDDVDKENHNGHMFCDVPLLDPQVSKTKGAPKRMKPRIEKKRKRGHGNKSKKNHLLDIEDSIPSSIQTQI